uniref:TROVE domain-containing protein n=2 Tax=viral metagenome TaxID=1070528 RepID=A0A6M3L8R9_9ZZZZ
MAKLNIPRKPIYTHEGGKAKHINPTQQLKRSVMSCMLWEKQFYEDGQAVADRISSLVPKIAPEKVAEIAIEAREKMKLRHVPLLIVREMARIDSHKGHVSDTLSKVIQRADELAEFLAIYWST